MKSFLPFIIIAVCIGMYFVYISPTWAEVQTLSAKKAEYQNVLDKVKELTAERDAAISAYNSIPSDDIDKLSKIIPAKFDSVTLANDISNLAGKYGLIAKEFKSDEPTTADRTTTTEVDKGPFRTVTVSAKVDGTYDSFLKFLKDLETSLHLMDVVHLEIKTIKGKNPTQDTLEFTFDIHVYSLE